MMQESVVNSDVFEAKEEFIFVFGGHSAYHNLNSIEVLDVQREIWRLFDDCDRKDTDKSEGQLY